MAEWQVILVFVASLSSTLIPSALVLWRFNVSEKRKSVADTAVVFQTLANKCADDLLEAHERIRDLKEYVKQLTRVIEMMGGTPPRMRKGDK